MKKAGLLVIALAIALPVCGAQPGVLTHPALPERHALDRMNLQLAWRTMIPVESRRDGIASVQNLGDAVIVQTRRGAVASLDPTTGAVRWFTSVGLAYPVTHDVGYNDELILVGNGTRIHALDRSTGLQIWEVNLPATPSSPATADERSFYVHLGSARVAAYSFPPLAHEGLPGAPKAGAASKSNAAQSKNTPPGNPSQGSNPSARTVRFSGAINTRTGTVSAQVAASGVTGGRTATVGSQINKQGRGIEIADTPQLLWFFQTNLRVTERPVLGETTLLVVSNDRKAMYLDRETGVHLEDFIADSPFTAPPGQFKREQMAYLGSRDGGVFALDLSRRLTMWHYTANSIVITAAVATDQDVFVAADRGGLIRLDRATGQPIWQNFEGRRFLAVNPKFAYVFDHQGRLLVLDRGRGTTISTFDGKDFVMPVVNETTDRLFLAAHDGTILCLHDKAFPQPVYVQRPLSKVEPAREAAGRAAPATDKIDK